MSESEVFVVIALVLGLALIYLMTKRWFWLAAFGLGALASAFSCLASIIHFQIFGAVLFFLLAAGLAWATLWVLDR